MGYHFDLRHERDHMNTAMVDDYQREMGTTILWFRFAGAANAHPIYGESYPSGGAEWDAPFHLPVLDVVPYEGQEQRENGFYTTDRVYVRANVEQLRRVGMDDLDTNRNMLRDRFVHRGVVYDVTLVNSQGRIRDEDMVVRFDGVEVDPDELVNSERFAEYAD